MRKLKRIDTSLSLFGDHNDTSDDKLFGSPATQKVASSDGLTSQTPNSARVQIADKVLDVILDGNGLLPANPLYEAEGKPKNKAPKDWLRTEEAISFIAATASDLKVATGHLLRIKSGRGGGTWFHNRLYIAYGMYLNPNAKTVVIEGFKQFAREERDPELKANRAHDALIRKFGEVKGNARYNGIPARKKFTAETQKRMSPARNNRNLHQLLGNAELIAITGCNAKEIKEKSTLPKSAPARDALHPGQLALMQFVEESIVTTWVNKRSLGDQQLFDHALPIFNMAKEFSRSVEAYAGEQNSSEKT